MTRRRTQASKPVLSKSDKLPFIEHVHELRRRLTAIAVCVVVGSVAAYVIQQQVVAALLRPSHGQNFIYTSPLGGINFLFSVCLDIGLVIATPIIIYHLLAFLQPLMEYTTRRFLIGTAVAAGVVALAGVAFGYFVGLPHALDFLLHQFTTIQVKPLITIESYLKFVALYLLGSALMFQLPLILLIINRITPLKPRSLLKYERHLIVGAFILAFVMDPNPNLLSQLMVVLPIIGMYQIGIGMVWFLNRSHQPGQLQILRERDAKIQAERAARSTLRFAEPYTFAPVVNTGAPASTTEIIASAQAAPATPPQLI